MVETVYIIFLFIYAALNAVSFILYGLDKSKARKKIWRIPEKTLLTISLFGPIGAWFGMMQFRHKTQKTMFRYLVPGFVGVHLLLALWLNL